MSPTQTLSIEVGRRDIESKRPEKVFYPKDGITKGDVVQYYHKVADTMLPHVRDRPVAMKRYPDGIEGKRFFQKDTPDYFPSWIPRKRVAKKGGHVDHVVVDDPATLVYLADQACITPHIWLSRKDKLHHPDRLIFDLDPPEGSRFAPVRDAARALREVMDEVGLEPFVMTTGSKGLHVVAPLDRSARFEDVRAFAKEVAQLLARREPKAYTVETRKDKRKGRVFLDYLRNGYAQTSVAPYALRARPKAPVATPLDWEELGQRGMHPRRFTLRNLPRRLAQEGDPWVGIQKHARGLQGPRRKLEKRLEEERQAQEA